MSLAALILAAGFTTPATAQKAIELSDEQVENIVRRSCPYVALYNVNHKFALDESAAAYSGPGSQSSIEYVYNHIKYTYA